MAVVIVSVMGGSVVLHTVGSSVVRPVGRWDRVVVVVVVVPVVAMVLPVATVVIAVVAIIRVVPGFTERGGRLPVLPMEVVMVWVEIVIDPGLQRQWRAWVEDEKGRHRLCDLCRHGLDWKRQPSPLSATPHRTSAADTSNTIKQAHHPPGLMDQLTPHNGSIDEGHGVHCGPSCHSGGPSGRHQGSGGHGAHGG